MTHQQLSPLEVFTSPGASPERLQIAAEELCDSLCFGGEAVVRTFDVQSHGAAVLPLLALTNEVHTPLNVILCRLLAIILDQVPRSFSALVPMSIVPTYFRLISKGALQDSVLGEEVVKGLLTLSMDCPNAMCGRGGARTLTEIVVVNIPNHQPTTTTVVAGLHPFLVEKLLLVLSNVFSKVKPAPPGGVHWPQILQCSRLLIQWLHALTQCGQEQQQQHQHHTGFLSSKIACNGVRAIAAVVGRFGVVAVGELVGSIDTKGLLSTIFLLLEDARIGEDMDVQNAVRAVVYNAVCWDPTTTLRGLLGNNIFQRHICNTSIQSSKTQKAWVHFMCTLFPPVTRSGLSNFPSDSNMTLDITSHVEVRSPGFQWSWEDDYHNTTPFDVVTSAALEATYSLGEPYHSGVYLPHMASFLSVFYFQDMQQVALDGNIARKIHRNVVPTGTITKTLQPVTRSVCKCPEDPQQQAFVLAKTKEAMDVTTPVEYDTPRCCGCFPASWGSKKALSSNNSIVANQVASAASASRVRVTHNGQQVDVLMTTATLCEDVAAASHVSVKLLSVWKSPEGCQIIVDSIIPYILRNLELGSRSEDIRDCLYILSSAIDCLIPSSSPTTANPGHSSPTNNVDYSTLLPRRQILFHVSKVFQHCKRNLYFLYKSKATVSVNGIAYYGFRQAAIRKKFLSELSDDGQMCVLALIILNQVLQIGSIGESLNQDLLWADVHGTLNKLESSLRSLVHAFTSNDDDGRIDDGASLPSCPIHLRHEHIHQQLLQLCESMVGNLSVVLSYSEGEDDVNALCVAVVAGRSLPSVEVLKDLGQALYDHDVSPSMLFQPACNVPAYLAMCVKGLSTGSLVEYVKSDEGSVWSTALDQFLSYTRDMYPSSMSATPLSVTLGLIHERLCRIVTIRVSVVTIVGSVQGGEEEAAFLFTVPAVMWSSVATLVNYVISRPNFLGNPNAEYDVFVDGCKLPSKSITILEALLTRSASFAPFRKLLSKMSECNNSTVSVSAWKASLVRTLSLIGNVQAITLHPRRPTAEVLDSAISFPVVITDTLLHKFPKSSTSYHKGVHTVLSFLTSEPRLMVSQLREKLGVMLIDEINALTVVGIAPSLLSCPHLSDILQESYVAVSLMRAHPQLFSLEVRRHVIQCVSTRQEYFTGLHFANTPRQAIGFDVRKVVKVHRETLLIDAPFVLRRVGPFAHPLDVEFEGEVGSGSGVTSEFFTLTGMLLVNEMSCLWRSTSMPLFPTAYATAKAATNVPSSVPDPTVWFYVIGVLIARCLKDGRVLPVRFHDEFLRMVLQCEPQLNPSVLDVSHIDPELENSLQQLEQMSATTTDTLQSIGLTFTFGNPPVELVPGGAAIEVTKTNVCAYTRSVREYVCHSAIQYAIAATRSGIDDTIPLEYVRLLSVEELSYLVSGNPLAPLWVCEDDLWNDIIPGHGYDLSSPQIQWLVEVVSSFPQEDQHTLWMFLSGSRQKPFGSHKITVVRKDADQPSPSPPRRSLVTDAWISESSTTARPITLTSDEMLPTVNTCFLYLKLPPYSSKDVMEERIRTAMVNGSVGFSLS
eukprot:PhF_6_TR44165/c0_g1_i2/m.67637/K10590/TRIP12; E3 ubiquitin-protein ligase TRIP12